MTRLDLYHRTSPAGALAIIEAGRFRTRENTAEAYVSDRVDGQAVGYGPVVVHVRIEESDAGGRSPFPPEGLAR